MAYCIYLRKSRADIVAEARDGGDCLSNHKRTLLDLASQRHFPIQDIYAEIVSGDTIADRPEMQRMLSRIENGLYEGVLCMDIDRLGRGDGADQARILRALKFSHTRIITPYQTFDPFSSETDEEFLEISQHFARIEYRHINRRMWAGRVASARSGRWQSPRAPFGYERVCLPGGVFTLSPVQAEADAVRMMFDLYGSGEIGKNLIAERINSMGLRTHRANPFNASSVGTILKNPVYLGKVRWCFRRKKVSISNGQEITTRPLSDECMLYEGLHPAIITQEMWDKVQARFSTHDAPPCKSGYALRNPLSGLIFCSQCGHAMVMGFDRTRFTFKCLHRGCPTSSIDSSCVYAVIKKTLSGWRAMSDRPDDPVSRHESNSASIRISAAQSALDALLLQRTRLQELVESGAYSVSTFIDRNAINEARIQSATKQLEEAKAVSAPTESIISHRDQITHVLDVWDSSTPAELNALLRQIIRRIDYTKTRHCYHNENPADFLTLDIYPTIS